MRIIRTARARASAWIKRKIRTDFPFLHARNENLAAYAKPYLDPAGLVAKMVGNGLAVANPALAEDFLRKTNYYRFKVYLRPYLTSPTAKTFVPGSDFDSAVQLYLFDEELRSFVFGLTSQVEVRFRHVMDQRLTVFTNDPFWYLRNEPYKSFPHRTLGLLRGSFDGSKEEFAKHYLRTYHSNVGGRYNFLPPFWIASEVLTLGQLHKLVQAFEKPFFASASPSGTNELDALAKDFGAFNVGYLTKWLEYVRNLRNWSAHHSRLWNRHMAEPPNVERNLSVKAPSRHLLYHNLAMLRTMLKSQGQTDGIKAAMLALFAKYPVADAEKRRMGFPQNWTADPFW